MKRVAFGECFKNQIISHTQLTQQEEVSYDVKTLLIRRSKKLFVLSYGLNCLIHWNCFCAYVLLSCYSFIFNQFLFLFLLLFIRYYFFCFYFPSHYCLCIPFSFYYYYFICKIVFPCFIIVFPVHLFSTCICFFLFHQ